MPGNMRIEHRPQGNKSINRLIPENMQIHIGHEETNEKTSRAGKDAN